MLKVILTLRDGAPFLQELAFVFHHEHLEVCRNHFMLVHLHCSFWHAIVKKDKIRAAAGWCVPTMPMWIRTTLMIDDIFDGWNARDQQLAVEHCDYLDKNNFEENIDYIRRELQELAVRTCPAQM